MTLIPDPAVQGLWRAETEIDAGVHAVLVGISAYDYLAGSTTPARDTLGMGQLAVSAATAAQIFDWLRQAARFGGRPVATCMLLLAPGNAKLVDGHSETDFVDGLTGGWYASPTYDGLAQAIGDWANRFVAASPQQQPRNGAFFFFSGHGVEILTRPSLLARDILVPNSYRDRLNAIDYKAVMEALPTFGLGDALFLIDCCRNTPTQAAGFSIEGQSVLRPSMRSVEGPNSSMFLKAAGLNQRAFQDPASDRRATIFGQAILEALDGVPPTYHPYNVETAPWRLLFEGLESFTKQRVAELLTAKDPSLRQNVVAGGDPVVASTLMSEQMPPPPGSGDDDSTTAAIAPEFAALHSDFSTPVAGATALGGYRDMSGVMNARAIERTIEARSRMAAAPLSEEASVYRPGSLASGTVSDFSNFEVMHAVLGHEHVTQSWVRMLELTDSLKGERLEQNMLRLHSARHSADGGLAWIDLRVAPGEGFVWLALNAADWDGPHDEALNSLAVLLPRDERDAIPVRLECRFEAVGDHWAWAPTELVARIGGSARKADGIWGLLHQAEEARSLFSAESAARILQRGLVSLRRQRRDPDSTASILANAMLFASGAGDATSDWFENFSTTSRVSQDALALRAESIIRREKLAFLAPGPADRARATWFERSGAAEAASCFGYLALDGLPTLGPTLAMAASQAQFWRDRLDAIPSDELRRAMARSVEMIDTASQLVTPDTSLLSLRSRDRRFGVPAEFLPPQFRTTSA